LHGVLSHKNIRIPSPNNFTGWTIFLWFQNFAYAVSGIGEMFEDDLAEILTYLYYAIYLIHFPPHFILCIVFYAWFYSLWKFQGNSI
jgi:hypothetical protein